MNGASSGKLQAAHRVTVRSPLQNGDPSFGSIRVTPRVMRRETFGPVVCCIFARHNGAFVKSDDHIEGAIREGDPPDARNTSSRPAAPPVEGRIEPSYGIAGAALVCACLAWLGTFMILMADMGRVPREIKLGGVSHLVVGVCWLIAIFGGMFSIASGGSKAGFLALLGGILLPMTCIGLVSLVGSGWLD